MAVRLGIGVVERLAADRAEPCAVVPAERPGGESEDERIVRPAVDVQHAVGDVGAAQFLVLGPGLVHLARVDLDRIAADSRQRTQGPVNSLSKRSRSA